MAGAKPFLEVGFQLTPLAGPAILPVPNRPVVKQIFEIQAPGYEPGKLAAEIEQELAAGPFDPDEVRRVEELSFAPISPSGERGFDPALTAELFERPVEAPSFRSRKFRFIRGPLRWLASALFRFLVQLDEKLSENRVQAFYHVVHELIALSHRYEKLQERFSALQESILARDGSGTVAPATAHAVQQGVAGERMVPGLPEAAPALRRANRALAERVAESAPGGKALCLDDSWGYFAYELRAAGLRATSTEPEAWRAALVEQATGESPLVGGCMTLLAAAGAAYDVVSHLKLEGASEDPEELPRLLEQRCRTGALACLRYQPAISDLFRFHPRCEVDGDRLVEAMQKCGFELLFRGRPAADSSASFEMLFRKGS